MSKGSSNRKWLIEKVKDGPDYRKGSQIVYTGNKRGVPTGWKVIRELPC